MFIPPKSCSARVVQALEHAAKTILGRAMAGAKAEVAEVRCRGPGLHLFRECLRGKSEIIYQKAVCVAGSY